MRRKSALLGVCVVAVAAAAVVAIMLLLMPASSFSLHTIQVTTHFKNAAGLREGAAVRVAGVDVGKVKTVRVVPEIKDGPVEVLMKIGAPYGLRIPNDSVVLLETAGILGETYVDIHIASASGPPLANHGVLKSRETDPLCSEQMIQMLGDILSKQDGPKSGVPKASDETRHHASSDRQP